MTEPTIAIWYRVEFQLAESTDEGEAGDWSTLAPARMPTLDNAEKTIDWLVNMCGDDPARYRIVKVEQTETIIGHAKGEQ